PFSSASARYLEYNDNLPMVASGILNFLNIDTYHSLAILILAQQYSFYNRKSEISHNVLVLSKNFVKILTVFYHFLLLPLH
ncbi:MAG: hypothetical protein WBI37_10100, partial [Tepidanaerobacteraceae bacterium]